MREAFYWLLKDTNPQH